MIEPKDLIINVGLGAYEMFLGKEVANRHISVVREKYSTAVYIKHIPTNLSAYCNDYRSQVKNRDKCLDILNEL